MGTPTQSRRRQPSDPRRRTRQARPLRRRIPFANAQTKRPLHRESHHGPVTSLSERRAQALRHPLTAHATSLVTVWRGVVRRLAPPALMRRTHSARSVTDRVPIARSALTTSDRRCYDNETGLGLRDPADQRGDGRTCRTAPRISGGGLASMVGASRDRDIHKSPSRRTGAKALLATDHTLVSG